MIRLSPLFMSTRLTRGRDVRPSNDTGRKKMKETAKKRKVGFTINPELLKEIELLAEKEHRNLSNMIEKIILDGLKKGGKN